MALDIINSDDPNNKDKDSQNQGSATSTPPPAAGTAPAQPGSGVNTTGQGQQASSAAPATGNRTGSGFVNLQNVISANKQNKLGSTVSQGLQGVAGNVRQGIQSNQDLFQQETDKNRLGTDQDVQNRNDIINRITGYQAPDTVNSGASQNFNENTGQAVNTVGQGPNAGNDLVSQNDADTFQKYRSGAYQGPQSLRDYDQLTSQAQQAQELGQNINSSGGRQALLQQFVGQNPNYSSGKQALDSLLLGQTGSQDLKQGRQSTFGLNNEVGSAENLAEQQGQAATSLAQQFGQDTTAQLGGKDTGGLIGNIYGKADTTALNDPTKTYGLAGALANKQAQADTDYQGFQQRLANKQLTQDDVNKYLNPLLSNGGVDQNTSLLGLKNTDLAKGITEGKFNLEDVTDPTQLAKINALQKLAGTNDINLDASKLGANTNNLIIDPTQFSSYRANQDQLNSQLQPYQSLLDQEQARQDYFNNNILKSPEAKQNLQNQLAAINSTGQGNIENGYDDSSIKAKQYYDLLNNAGLSSTAKLFGSGGANGKYAIDPNSDVKNLIENNFEPAFTAQNNSSDINRLNGIIGQIKQDNTAKYGGGNIEDLMASDEKAKFDAAHPTSLSQLESQGQSGLYDASKYNDLYNQYLPQNLPGGGAKDSLLDSAVNGYKNYVGGAIAGPLAAIGSLFSDEKLKKNIKSGDKHVENFLDKISPYQYEYNNPEHGTGNQLGIMAQDLEKTDEGKFAVENTPEGKMVHFGKLSAMMMASQSNLHKRLKDLEGRKK